MFPLAFGFLTHAAPEGVLVSTDIRSYLDFVMALFMAFGVSFEVPVAIVLLCWMGVTTPEELRKTAVCPGGRLRGGYAADTAGRILADAAGHSDVLSV